MKTSQFHKVTMDVGIEDYSVTEEAGASIIELLESGVCPLCAETASFSDFKIPKENEMVETQCKECKIKFTVESWITK